MDLSIAEIFTNAEDNLDLVKRGLIEFLESEGRQRASGIRNVVIFGRITTWSLQGLKRHYPGRFEDWWGPLQAEMHADGEFHYLYDLRNDAEHKGRIGSVSLSMHIDLSSEDLERLMQDPPPNADFFIGDSWGGSGWRIRQPDGSVEKFYVHIPADIAVKSIHHFAEPSTQLHLPPPRRPIGDVLSRYVVHLESIIRSARREFGNPAP